MSARTRISDARLAQWITLLKGRSEGRMDGDTCSFTGSEIRELVGICEDLQAAIELLERTAWLRGLGKKGQR